MDTAVYRIRYRKFWKRWLLASTIHRDWAWWASQEFLDTGFSRPLAPKLANASLTRLPFSQTSSTIWRIARFGMLINPPPSSLHILLLSTWQIIRDSLNTTSLSLLSSPCGRPRSEALKHARSGFRSPSIIDKHRMGYRSTLDRSVALSQLKRQQSTKRHIQLCLECFGRDGWPILMEWGIANPDGRDFSWINLPEVTLNTPMLFSFWVLQKYDVEVEGKSLHEFSHSSQRWGNFSHEY